MPRKPSIKQMTLVVDDIDHVSGEVNSGLTSVDAVLQDAATRLEQWQAER